MRMECSSTQAPLSAVLTFKTTARPGDGRAGLIPLCRVLSLAIGNPTSCKLFALHFWSKVGMAIACIRGFS